MLLLSATALSIDKPAIEWVKLYEDWDKIESVIETSDGGFAVTVLIIGVPEYSFFKLDQDGALLWGAPFDLYAQRGKVVVELETGHFAVAGWAKETEEASVALMVAEHDANGVELWTKLYNSQYPGSESASSMCSLPDGGFAICGSISPAEGMDQAWILRTDSQGDTLWTREWGWVYNDAAMSILYIEDGLTVLMQGNTPSTPGGPHLVRYDMDGNLLWEMQLDFPGGVTCFAQQMCRASDGGLLVLDNYHPEIAHYDLQGNFDWYFAPPGVGEPWGWSVSTTMDGGILFGGECADNPERKGICGMISRHNADGMELWRDYVYNSGCDIIYSAIQLSQGGYIAAGQANGQGYLIKYAPEMGIEETTPSAGIEMSVFPNPCSSELSVIFGLPEAGSASVHIYDLPGRLVSVVADGEFPSGSNTITWTVPEGLSSGCYLVRMDTSYGHITENCVLIR